MKTAVEVDAFLGRVRRQQERAAARPGKGCGVIPRSQDQVGNSLSTPSRKHRKNIQDAPEQPVLAGGRRRKRIHAR